MIIALEFCFLYISAAVAAYSAEDKNRPISYFVRPRAPRRSVPFFNADEQPRTGLLIFFSFEHTNAYNQCALYV